MAGTFYRFEGESILNILVLYSDTHLCEQMVRAQQTRDQKIVGLVTTMEDTYSFVVSAEELNSQSVLQDIVEKMLKQTIECGYFIQEYVQRNFVGM